MHRTCLALLPLLAGPLVLAGCAATATFAPAPAPEPAGTANGTGNAAPGGKRATEAPGAAAPEVADPAFRRALERAVADPASREALRLFTECRRDAGLESVEVFGGGVAIVDGRRQIEIGPEGVTMLLATLADGGFAAMPNTFGGDGGFELKPRPRPGDDGVAAVRVLCRVEASVGGRTKMVAQLEDGFQSPELRALSETFFRLVEDLPGGAVIADLADGLDKLARGELAPECLRVMVQRQPDAVGAGEEGFRLRVEGGRATTRVFRPAAGFVEPRALRLAPSELAELALALESADPERLPVNLYAPVYTDVAIEVLDRKVTVQARGFAGMTPATHGERQAAFDRLFETLAELHRRVVGDGEPVAERR